MHQDGPPGARGFGEALLDGGPPLDVVSIGRVAHAAEGSRSRRACEALAILLVLLAGCRAAPTCEVAGRAWRVLAVGCEGVAGDLLQRGGVAEARYDLTGDPGRSRWALPGCELDVELTASERGDRVALHETRHACRSTGAGEAGLPCCESGAADLRLEFACSAAGPSGARTLTAALAAEGAPVGPWAGRGPWRGCAAGALATLTLLPEP